MIRFAAILFTLVAFACGGDEGQPPGGAAGGAGEAGERADAADPSVQGCLDLVRAKRYAEAIAPCTEALSRAPENREVQMALEEASREAALQVEGVAEKGLTEALP